MKRRSISCLCFLIGLILGMPNWGMAQNACGFSLGSGTYNKWMQLGGERGFLGCPIMHEAEAGRSPQGTTGRWVEFRGGDGGYIIWHGSGRFAGRAFEVHGCIFKLYKSLVGTLSWLGFPISDEYAAPGGSRSDFEGGYVYWEANTRRCRAFRYNSSGSGGICDDPRTLAIMDEWLARAIPPQQPGESLRYEAWGRRVGRSLTAINTVSGPPDTRLTRCEYLWQYASKLFSSNGLGTLREYVERRRQ